MTVSAAWYLTLAAAMFSIGAIGLLVRRNVLVMFMCVELMLNAANLALIAYARYTHTMAGQVFALIVIAVAASEVVVGLALITGVYRSGHKLNLDELSEMSE